MCHVCSAEIWVDAPVSLLVRVHAKATESVAVPLHALLAATCSDTEDPCNLYICSNCAVDPGVGGWKNHHGAGCAKCSYDPVKRMYQLVGAGLHDPRHCLRVHVTDLPPVLILDIRLEAFSGCTGSKVSEQYVVLYSPTTPPPPPPHPCPLFPGALCHGVGVWLQAPPKVTLPLQFYAMVPSDAGAAAGAVTFCTDGSGQQPGQSRRNYILVAAMLHQGSSLERGHWLVLRKSQDASGGYHLCDGASIRSLADFDAAELLVRYHSRKSSAVPSVVMYDSEWAHEHEEAAPDTPFKRPRH
jgi:hypothetical protein